jgi:hypothetical protein
MPERSYPCGRRERLPGWAPCRAAAIGPPRRVLVRRSGGHREADLRRPGAWLARPWQDDGMLAYNAHVPVDCCYSLVCSRLEQLAGDKLLQRQHDTILAPDSDCCASVLDCLDCVFDLAG